jgi:hypothetical protein
MTICSPNSFYSPSYSLALYYVDDRAHRGGKSTRKYLGNEALQFVLGDGSALFPPTTDDSSSIGISLIVPDRRTH